MSDTQSDGKRQWYEKSYLIFAKNIQVGLILLRLSIEEFEKSAYSLTVQPFDYKFYKQICFKSQFVDLMEKTFFVLQYKVNGMAEIFCKNVKVKGHNQSQDVLLVDIWKLQ